MLKNLSRLELTVLPGESQRLWHDSSVFAPSLGCLACPDSGICGGLSVAPAIFNCMDLCCGDPSNCGAVCRRNPNEFARRVREIAGFTLDNVPRAAELIAPGLPNLVPVIFHRHRRSSEFAGPGVACLPMQRLIDARTGEARFSSAEHLRDRFRLCPGTAVIMTGTSTDPALEKWWSLSDRRIAAIRALKGLNVSFATTPNYSLFVDQPRWDDLHSMKRIALVHHEFLSEGIPTALHLNARTERDWERWGRFVADRPEITHVAFEFSTGAGWAGRIDWYLSQFEKFRATVARPLRLVVRGGIRILPRLATVFEQVVFLDTSIFVKTMRRKAAFADPGSRIRWRHAPTGQGEPLDDLLNRNWSVVSAIHPAVRCAARVPRKAA